MTTRGFGKVALSSAVLFHFVVYWFAGIFLVVLLSPSITYSLFGTDFKIGYDLSVALLDNPSYFYDVYSPFLYNPALALYFLTWGFFFYVLAPVELFWVMVWHNLSFFFWNLGSTLFIYKIVAHPATQRIMGSSIFKNPFLLPALYIALPLHYLEYFVGQINAPAAFFIMVGIYYLVQGKENVCYACFSVAMIFKIIAGFFIVFMLLSQKGMKRFLRSLLHVIVPQLPTLLFLLLFPQLVIEVLNQVLFTVGSFSSSPLHHFGNLVTFLKGTFEVSTVLSVILMAAIFLPSTLFILRTRSQRMGIFDTFMLITLVFINITPIFYVLHLKILLGFVLPWLVTRNLHPVRVLVVVKLLVGIPFLSMFSWFYFPYYPFVFLAALVLFDVLILSGTSDKEPAIMLSAS